ncbi:sigma-70 family RNA polymerase sigma factor [Fulvivirgaceae bacterium BMA10]|uniref:Sigma-70 family RNA polymerase sigma factor n=1 Tax=Splendidivirga corallicola TaxID=3051826 RepID=A0ABT8KKG3_9BACT|nr:sigma-70 family RNA polymerase sigma factor [Fulvivirgaceae bacterium BMA10]
MLQKDQHREVLSVEVEENALVTHGDTKSFEAKNELEIWKEFKKGNESAFTHIYRTYFSSLFRYSSQFTHDKELIKDSIQDLFIELRKNRKNLSDTDSIKLYLFKSIRRKVIASKERIRKNLVDRELLDGYNFKITFSIEHLTILRQIKEEKLSRLNLAIEKLTRRQKEVIYYFYHENMSYDEVKSIMDLKSTKSARNLLYKALHVLKSEMT